MFPCYEKLGDSISPSFDRFRATRFERLLQALQKELQPSLPDSHQLIFSLERRSYQLVGSQSEYIKRMLNKIISEIDDYHQLLLLCEVNIQQQKLLEAMVKTYESYRTSQIQKYLGRVQTIWEPIVLIIVFVTRSDLYPVLNDLPDYADSRLPTKFAIFNLDPRSLSAQKSFFQLHDLSKIIDDVINNDDFSVFHVDSLNSPGIGLYCAHLKVSSVVDSTL